MILAVALSPAVDVTYVVDAFPEGAQTRPREVHRVAGGKAVNAARAAAALGARVRVLTALGGHTGQEVAEGVRRAGIGLAAVDAAAPTRTCVSVFSDATGRLTEIYEHAPAIAENWPELLAELDTALAEHRPSWVLLSGSMPETGDPDPLGEIAARVAHAGAGLAIDTHGAALRRALELDPPPAVIKINRAEGAAVLDAGPESTAGDLATALHHRTGATVIVTDGEAGSAAVDADISVRAVLPEVHGGYPVGSGDSFLGALLTALDADEPLTDALTLAVATATANALVPGAANFRPEDVPALRARVLLEGLGGASRA